MPAEVPTADEFRGIAESHVALAEHVEGIDEQVRELEERAARNVTYATSTTKLREAIDHHAEHGTGGTVHIAPGVYQLGASQPLPSYVRLVGSGTGATRIDYAGAGEVDHVLAVTDHASSVSIEKLSVFCNKKARTGVRIVPAPRDPDNGKDFGITAPDPRHRMTDVEIYDAGHTGVVLGEHARGSKLNSVVVRRAGTVGFHCGMADSDLVNCEATTLSGAAYSGSAAFWIGSVNSRFIGCKGWWGRGSGWRVRGTRNAFVACEAQDTAWHGWYVEWDKNTFTGCIAENAGFAGSGGIGGVDGWFFTGAGSNTVGGCHARNRSENGASQRHGFSVPAEMLQPLPDSGSKTPRLYGESGYLNLGKLVHVR